MWRLLSNIMTLIAIFLKRHIVRGEKLLCKYIALMLQFVNAFDILKNQ